MRHSNSSHHAGSLVVAAALWFACAGGAVAQGSWAAEFTSSARGRAYSYDLFGPSALIGVAAGATLDHLRDEPETWEDNSGGFGRRLASNAGRHVVNQTVRHGLAITLGRTTRYHRCTCTDFTGRVGNAIVETFTDRGRDGNRMISIPRFGGATAGALAENLWLPEADKNEVLLDAVRSVAYGALSNIAKELIGWPR
jgi:hypothetical protein